MVLLVDEIVAERTEISTTPSKPGARTQKFFQRKHVPSIWEDFGDMWRAHQMKKRAKDSKPDTEGDKPHHAKSGAPPGFSPQSNNRNLNENDNMFQPPQFHGTPSQASSAAFSGFQVQGHAQSPPQQQQQHHWQPQALPMQTMNNAHALQSGEMNPHMQRGGQTELGERPRGQGPSVYIDADRTVPGGGRGGGVPSSRQPQHPWMPETRHYMGEQTRRR